MSVTVRLTSRKLVSMTSNLALGNRGLKEAATQQVPATVFRPILSIPNQLALSKTGQRKAKQGSAMSLLFIPFILLNASLWPTQLEPEGEKASGRSLWGWDLFQEKENKLESLALWKIFLKASLC